jgi:dihydrolipoamide dehydrogenase
VWKRLGSEVTVVEFLDRLVPGMDAEVAKTFERVLGKQGIKFRLGTKVTAASLDGNAVKLTLEPAKGGEAESIEADVVLVAIGRRAFTDGMGIKEAGVELDERGRVKVDAHYATNVPGIYAIGDVIAGPMLAHKAEEEGVAAAERIAGQAGHVNYDVIPGVVYTWPEVASIGATEEHLKQQGVDYLVGKFPFTANGRARAMGSTDGFVKILADKATDRVLGAHIIGPDAGTLIAEIATAMEFGASSEDIARTCHAHPSLSEAVKEAALAVEGRAIHI